MEVLHHAAERVVFRMHANETLANALRRSINEIPVLGIDEIEIYKNDSALYDEMLAHRVGLLPIKNEGPISEKREVVFKLSKVGPCTVVAGDLQGEIEVVHPLTPLVLLEKDQEVEFVATARVGRGITHEKYMSGLGFYRHLTRVTTKNAHVQKLIETSTGLIKPEKTKDGWICDIDDARAAEINTLDPDALHDADEIVFIIESFGQMSAKDVALKAIHALGENVEAFEKALS